MDACTGAESIYKKNTDTPWKSEDFNKEERRSSGWKYSVRNERKNWRRDENNGDKLPTSFHSNKYSYSHQDRYFQKEEVDIEQIVYEQFNKKFSLEPSINEEWHLPDASEMFSAEKWMDCHFQKLKKELNDVKNKLNHYNLDDWHKHTRLMNKAGEIQWKLRREIDPEFLTQAWCKFYENAMQFALVPPKISDMNSFNSIHLCEAPGAFITSLNHYLKTFCKGVKWNWLATTLNPYYEGNPLSCMINDDRFILQTLDHWYFGKDFTGDLMNINNLLDLMEKTNKMEGGVLLVTADGSIDCQEDPGEQEAIVSALHYCEAVTALNILSEGGSFLLKMFTMYEEETICLMYLLCCSFKAVNVYKPATSKEGNSEVYVVCLEYKGKYKMEPWLKILRQYFGSSLPPKAMFPKAKLPPSFLEKLYSCTAYFKKLQTNVIEGNIESYHGNRQKLIKVKKIRSAIAVSFIERYCMEALNENDEIVGKEKLKQTVTLNLDPRTEEGSFNDKQKKKGLHAVDLFIDLKKELLTLNISWPFGVQDVKWIQFPDSRPDFSIQTGKAINVVNSSKFCLGRLLKIRNKVFHKAFHELKLSCNESVPMTTSKTIFSTNDIRKYESTYVQNFLKSNADLEKGLTIICLKNKPWYTGRYVDAERDAFWDIMDAIADFWRDGHLLIDGFPMLTQFNVGILYALCHMFNKVGFIKPDKQNFAVIFKEYRSWNVKMQKFLNKVDRTIEDLRDKSDDQTVLAVIPINVLCGKPPKGKEVESAEAINDSASDSSGVSSPKRDSSNSGTLFYQCVTEINHICVQEQVLDIINQTVPSNP